MKFKRFTNTPYLVLFIVLLSIGVGTAFALVTITLAGNVHITGDTELDGRILDTNDDSGTSGQLLSSTVVGIDWIDEPSGLGVPIGTVLDWWCKLGCTIPDGYMLADGSPITDVASPLLGSNVPNLIGIFVRGVDPTELDSNGGTILHSHSHDHPILQTFTANNDHKHTVTGAKTATQDTNHGHTFNSGVELTQAPSASFDQNVIGGLDSPLSIPTSNHQHFFEADGTTDGVLTNHAHDVDISSQNVSIQTSSHSHTVNVGFEVSSSEANLPPWHGLVKIIRIK